MFLSRRSIAVLSLAGALFMAVATIRATVTPAEADDPWALRSFESDWELTSPGSLPSDRVTGQSVFLPDDRIHVTDTSEWPFRLVAHLVLFDEDANPIGECSGMVLSPNSVLTAAHCVYDPDTETLYTGVLVVPGETALSEPYGFGIAVDVAMPNGWVETGEYKYDVAILKVEGADFMPEGPFAIIAGAPNPYLFDGNTFFFSAGYPGDKDFGSQWITAAPVEEVDFDFIYTSMDAFPGQSGSPVFTFNVQTELAYIVGVFSFETPLFNGAVRFNPTVIEALGNYCASLGCAFQSVMLSGPTPTPPTSTPTSTPTPSPSPVPTASPSPPPGSGTPSLPFRLRTQQLARDGLQ